MIIDDSRSIVLVGAVNWSDEMSNHLVRYIFRMNPTGGSLTRRIFHDQQTFHDVFSFFFVVVVVVD